jgi:pyruvate, water dikinase
VSHRFYWLDQIQAEHRSQVGESAIHLSHLAQHRFPVPPGIVVPASEFQRYAQKYLSHKHWSDSSPPSIWPAHQDVTATARQLQATLQNHVIDPELITAIQTNWPPLKAEFLLIQAAVTDRAQSELAALWTPQVCPIAELAPTLHRLWAETFCGRNIRYWQQTNYTLNRLPLATIVQPLSPTVASGQLWIDAETLIIQGFWGLRLEHHPWEAANLVVLSDRETGVIQSQRSHQQTVFYGIPGQLPELFAAADPLMVTSQSWLLPYTLAPLSPPCLDDTQVTTLITMGQQLWQRWQQPCQIDWQFDGEQILIQSCQATTTAAGFAHIDHDQWELASRSHTEPQPCTTGIAAAPGEITARAIVVTANQALLNELPPDSILVTTHLTPDWLPLIRQAVGIITEQGGTTSHAAILARELGIPAVVGVPHATQQFHTGDWLHLQRGKIYRADFATLALEHATALEPETALDRRSPPPKAPLSCNRPTQTHCLVTISQTEQLDQLRHHSIDGVGLIRAEHLLLPHLEKTHPWQWIQHHQVTHLSRLLTRQLQPILRRMSPRPVWYRTADWRSHELNALDGAKEFAREANPILGMHGAVSYQQFPEWLDLELRAIADLPPENHHNLRLLFPFVRTVEEFQFCQRRVQKAGLGDIPLWIMAEVPAVIFALPDYVAAGVQGMTIGMNDLVQLLFAIDRDQPKLSNLFNPNHPVIRQAVQQLIQTANQLNIPCNVCSLTEDEAFVEFLVTCGVTGISANIADLERVRRAIVQAENN